MENKKKAFVVDDSKLTQKQLSQILGDCGIEVVDIASNGQEALEKYATLKDKIDLVTLDITMPIVDGLTVLKKILETSPNARILMVSAIGKEATIQSCMMQGARNFIVKPFHADKVKEIVRSVVAA